MFGRVLRAAGRLGGTGKSAGPTRHRGLEDRLMTHGDFPFKLSDAEWRERLTPEQFDVMRGHGTERPGSCALLHEKRAGVFACAGCGQDLFASKLKFESGTGWPSFNDPVPGVGRDDRRSQLRHGPHRGPLQQLRQPSRPCVRRRPAAHWPALLHQRRRAGFQARVSRREERRDCVAPRCIPALRRAAAG